MAQIGPDYTYNSDSTIAPTTLRKIAIIARTRPEAASLVSAILGVGDSVPGLNLNPNANQILDSFDAYTRNLVLTHFAQELAIAGSQASSGGSGGGSGGQTGGGIFDRASQTVNNVLNEISLETGTFLGNASTSITTGIKDLMKPVSPFIGTTLVSLHSMVRDPLGAISRLPQTLLKLVESISPRLAGDIEGFFKSEKVSNFTRLPGLVYGSIKSIVQFVDFALALPAIILSDLYDFVADIMEGIADLIDRLMKQIIDFIFSSIFGWLDEIFPLEQILALLGDISSLMGDIAGITTAFFGPNVAAGWAFNIQGIANGALGVLTNPQQLIASFIPSQVNELLFTLRNPAQLVNSLIPPEIGNFLGKLQQMTGLGLNGNMGYSFLSVLEAFKGGILGNIIRNFSSQYRILSPLLNITSPGGGGAPYSTPIPAYLVPIVRTLIANGIIQPQDIPQSVFGATADELERRALPPI
jgi:hypothetical protein